MIFPNCSIIKANAQRKVKSFQEVLKGKSSRTRNMTTNDTNANNSARTSIPLLYKILQWDMHGKSSMKQIESNILKEEKEQPKTRESNKGSLLEQDALNDKKMSQTKFKPRKS
jgi:hypothetical protein